MREENHRSCANTPHPKCETSLKLFHLLPTSLSLSLPQEGLSFVPVQTLETVVQMWSNNGMKLPNLEKNIFPLELNLGASSAGQPCQNAQII